MTGIPAADYPAVADTLTPAHREADPVTGALSYDCGVPPCFTEEVNAFTLHTEGSPGRAKAERPSRYSVTEKYRADRAAVWTARVGRTVAVKVVSPQERGMWDTDLLRKALAEHAGVSVGQVRPVRARNDVQVAPRVWEVAPAEEHREALGHLDALGLATDTTEGEQ
ncbi:hypothetical protein [Streptomyces sp. NPDC001165]|uniref:hypothetical protein n=1 Tax=Streptomyces sp. NPDC001165 TaxID=3364546 RepID=UPI0036C18B22